MSDDPNDKPDIFDIVGYLVAAAILLPIGWWLKESDIVYNFIGMLFY